MRCRSGTGLLVASMLLSALPARAQTRSTCSPDTVHADGFVQSVRFWLRQSDSTSLAHHGLREVPDRAVELVRDPAICSRALGVYNARADHTKMPWLTVSESVYVIRVGRDRYVVLDGDPGDGKRDYMVYDLEFREIGGVVG